MFVIPPFMICKILFKGIFWDFYDSFVLLVYQPIKSILSLNLAFVASLFPFLSYIVPKSFYSLRIKRAWFYFKRYHFKYFVFWFCQPIKIGLILIIANWIYIEFSFCSTFFVLIPEILSLKIEQLFAVFEGIEEHPVKKKK